MILEKTDVAPSAHFIMREFQFEFLNWVYFMYMRDHIVKSAPPLREWENGLKLRQILLCSHLENPNARGARRRKHLCESKP